MAKVSKKREEELKKKFEEIVIHNFMNFRDTLCPHYTGILESLDKEQCRHPDHNGLMPRYCALDCCPYVGER